MAVLRKGHHVISMEINGVDGIIQNFGRLSVAIRDKALKKAMAETLKLIVEAAKAHCTSDLGTLKESIDYKISTKGTKGVAVRGIAGPRRGIKVWVRTVKRGKNKGKVLVAVPTRYAHLVEFGHPIVINGKTISQIAPKPFMRPAWDEEGGDVALNTFCDVLAIEVGREVDKLNVRNVTRAANGVPLL